MTPEEDLKRLGINLPEAAKAVGAYVPAVRTGNLVFTAGQIPLRDGEIACAGKVPGDVSLESAQTAARQCVRNALAALRGELGTLDAVRRVVRMNVYVASSDGFTGQAQVANAASELLTEVFGHAGRHTRCAVGVAELPLGAPVELDLIVETT